MLQIRKILQLLESGYSNRNIAFQLSISRNTLDYYKRQISLSDKSFQQLLALDDHEFSKIIYKEQSGTRKDSRYDRLAPQLNSFALELNRRGVTRYLLWQEYREKDAEGYSYQQFCEHLNTHLNVKSAVMHLDHKPAEKVEIDFAGGKMCYINEDTGELVECPILVPDFDTFLMTLIIPVECRVTRLKAKTAKGIAGEHLISPQAIDTRLAGNKIF